MNDTKTIVVKDQFGELWVMLFNSGNIGRPIIMMTEHEMDKLIKDYQDQKKEM